MIEKLVKDLPEVYQPVYGHPELSKGASRPCSDRLQQIEEVYIALEGFLKRPLKVLDLGCAQGFFSLSLAQRGAEVRGVDFLDKNVALCNALADENPSLNVSFSEGRIEDVVAALQPAEYDLVLGLSVFHHLVHAHGAPAVKALLEQLAQLGGTLVLEMALQTEPLYWGPSQPSEPRELIQSIAFVHLVAHHGTHLAPIPRPLFIASNEYWILGERAGKFTRWSFDPHAEAHSTHESSRRYYFSDEHVVKFLQIDHPTRGLHNKTEFCREIEFLGNPPPVFSAAHLVAHHIDESEAWVVLKTLPGRLLLDLIRDGVAFDSRQVLLAVLQQLAILEEGGLYHNDVRAWNVLLDIPRNSAYLIDYGSISNDSSDCAWPGNLFFSFFIFVKEIATRQVDNPTPLRTIAISPLNLPEPYRAWALTWWERPMAEWSFSQLHQSLSGWTDIGLSPFKDEEPMAVWMGAIEEAVQAQTNQFRLLSHVFVPRAEIDHVLLAANASETQTNNLRKKLTEQKEEAAQQYRIVQTKLEEICHHFQQSLQTIRNSYGEVLEQAQQRQTQLNDQLAKTQGQLQQALNVAQVSQLHTQKIEARMQQMSEKAAQAQKLHLQVQAQLELTQAQLHQCRRMTQIVQEQMQQALSEARRAEEQARRHLQDKQKVESEQATLQLQLQNLHLANNDNWLKLERTSKELQEIREANHYHWSEATHRLQQINDLYNSTSWRITAPLRWAARQLTMLRHDGLTTRIKAAIKKLLRATLSFALASPRVKLLGTRLALRLGVAKQLKNFIGRVSLEQAIDRSTIRYNDTDSGHDKALSDMTPRARRIYSKLRYAIDQQNGGNS